MVGTEGAPSGAPSGMVGCYGSPMTQPRARGRLDPIDAVLWGLSVASAGITLFWSFGPSPNAAAAFSGADKVMHAAAYFVTALLFFLAAVWRPGRGPGPLDGYRWVLVMAIIAIGGMVEIGQQAFTARRQAEFVDWIAEIVAVLGAFGVIALWRRSAD